MTLLSDLPTEHELRNLPLWIIGARYRNTFNPKSVWREVLPSFGIASYTYDELADCWTSNAEWKADDLLKNLWKGT